MPRCSPGWHLVWYVGAPEGCLFCHQCARTECREGLGEPGADSAVGLRRALRTSNEWFPPIIDCSVAVGPMRATTSSSRSFSSRTVVATLEEQHRIWSSRAGARRVPSRVCRAGATGIRGTRCRRRASRRRRPSGHPPAEGLARRPGRFVAARTRRRGIQCRPPRRDGDRRPIGKPSARLAVREVEAKRREAEIVHRPGESRHEGMPHAGARTVRHDDRGRGIRRTRVHARHRRIVDVDHEVRLGRGHASMLPHGSSPAENSFRADGVR